MRTNFRNIYYLKICDSAAGRPSIMKSVKQQYSAALKIIKIPNKSLSKLRAQLHVIIPHLSCFCKYRMTPFNLFCSPHTSADSSLEDN